MFLGNSATMFPNVFLSKIVEVFQDNNVVMFHARFATVFRANSASRCPNKSVRPHSPLTVEKDETSTNFILKLTGHTVIMIQRRYT